MRRSGRIGAGVVALGGVVLLAWIASHLEKVTETVDQGFRGAARANPYLACERLLGELGFESRSVPRLIDLPPVDHSVFVITSGAFQNERSVREVVDWVSRGGHLVVLLTSSKTAQSLLANRVRRKTHEFPLADELDVQLHAESARDDAPEDSTAEAEEQPAVARIDLGQGELEVALPGPIRFTYEQPISASDAPVAVLERIVGHGRATFVAGDAWMTNADIDEHDHARFAWQLANLGGPRRGAVIVHGGRSAGLLALLARHAWTVLATGAVFVVLWLWKSGARFGPLIAEPSRERRDFSEHVDAAANFLWRRGAAVGLLAAPRAELQRRIALVRPDLAALEREALHAELARIGGIDPAAVREALEREHVREPAPFRRIVRNLAVLRKNL